MPGKLFLPSVCLGPTAPCSPRCRVIDVSKKGPVRRMLCLVFLMLTTLCPPGQTLSFASSPHPAPPDTHTSLLFSHSASLHLTVCLPSPSCTSTSHWPRVLCSGIPVCSAVFGACFFSSRIAPGGRHRLQPPGSRVSQ